MSFNAVVLAGERGPDDALARAAGCASKVLVPVAGMPVILRAMTALDDARHVGAKWLVGPSSATLAGASVLSTHIAEKGWEQLEPADSPASSALAGLDHGTPPTLGTTADHGLLRAEIVDHFCAEALRSGADLVIGFTRFEDVMRAFPGGRRTGWRFRDGRFCGSNLYAFLTPRARRVADFWRSVENDRKRPWRVVRALGVVTLLRFLFRRMTLADALATLGRRTDTTIQPVVLPFPEAAVDVDSVGDWQLVNQWLEGGAG